ncbi:MAG TPA: FtsX-like permease family protein, partial [Thermoanaerobaculia bacterium]|nr:FtsX-like permease family protein [Thermoanaerobaculia bacterium]
VPSLGGTTMSFRAAGSGEEREANVRTVSARYFELMRVPFVRGGGFDPRPAPDAPYSIIVNRTAARQLGSEDLVGRSLRIGRNDCVIAGVVGDERVGPLDEPVTPVVYFHAAQDPDSSTTIVLRTAGDPAAMAPAATRVIQRVDPDIAIAGATPLEDIVASSPMTYLRRVTGTLVGAFALVALFLALVGIYAVVAESVAVRTKEIGVRITLGAQPRQILSMVAREAMALAAVGLVLGLAGALALTRFLKALLFEVGARDPLTLTAVSTLLLATALAASLIPALRAARTDPAVALRHE